MFAQILPTSTKRNKKIEQKPVNAATFGLWKCGHNNEGGFKNKQMTHGLSFRSGHKKWSY